MPARPNERSLRGGADVIQDPGTADVSFGGRAFGTALQQLGGAFFQAAQLTIEPIKQAVIEDQTKKGAIAGAAATTTLPSGEIVPTQPELRQGHSLADRAFNKAAVEATQARFNTAILVKAQELKNQFPADPKAFQSAFASYYRGLREGLRPEDRPEFDLVATRTMLPAQQKIFENFVEIKRDEQTASIQADIMALEAEGRFQAENLFSDNPNIATQAADHMEQIAAQLSKRYEAVDMQGRALFDPKTRKQAADKFVEDALLVASRAGLARADSKVSYITTLDQRLRGLGVKVTEDQFQAIEDQLYSDLNQAMNLEETMVARNTRQFERFQDANFEDLARRLDVVSRRTVEEFHEDGLIDLNQRNRLLAAVENPAEVTDTGAFLELRAAADGPSGDFYQLYKQLSTKLTPGDQRSIMESHLDAQAGGGFLRLEMVKRAYRELRTIHNDTGIISGLTGTAGAELAAASRAFDDVVINAGSAEEAIANARAFVDNERKVKMGEQVKPDIPASPAIVSQPGGDGIDVDASTRNLLEDLSRPDVPLDDLERQLQIIEEQLAQ